jgi:predicted PhzF superfamily epimerase YddE/YHI9
VTVLYVLRVFLGPGGAGGNPLGIVLDGGTVPAAIRQAVAARLAFSETVFVDERQEGVARVAIFTPAVELRFAGHPVVGTSWLLRELGIEVGIVRVAAGDVETWHDGRLTWIRADPRWVHAFSMVEYATSAQVDALRGPRLGDPGVYAWAWEDASAGILRARYFPTDLGIVEDEATGAAAVAMGGRMKRPLTIRQGIGSEIQVRPAPRGTVEVGGRVVLVEVRDATGTVAETAG